MRKVIHTSVVSGTKWLAIIATCEDGTVWESIYELGTNRTWTEWSKVPSIPSETLDEARSECQRLFKEYDESQGLSQIRVSDTLRKRVPND